MIIPYRIFSYCNFQQVRHVDSFHTQFIFNAPPLFLGYEEYSDMKDSDERWWKTGISPF